MKHSTAVRQLALLGALLLCAASGACRPEPVRPEPDAAGPPSCCRERPRGEDGPDARGRAELTAASGAPPMVITPRTHPALGFPPHGSIAVGTVTDGYLVAAAELPLAGPHHRVLREQAARRTNFGTDELVRLVQDAAAAVAAEHPGAVLHVGNIAKGGGGDIPWSVSHNTGLDADLLFYLEPTEPGAPPIEPETLVHVDRTGACVEIPGCRLDVPKTWALVAALATSDRASVQWLFVSNPVRELLLAHARRSRAPRAVVARVAAVLHQPAGALPHDDHIHIRLFCSRDDLLDGCANRGLERPEMPSPGPALAERIARLRRLLRDPAAERRAGALDLLRLLQAREAAGDIIARLADDEPSVRDAALAAVRALHLRSAVPALAAGLAREEDPQRRWELVSALAAVGGPGALSALVSALEDGRPASRGGPFAAMPSSVQRRAALALGALEAPDAVGPLVAALGNAEDAGFRRQAHRALRLLTNHDVPDGELASGARAWSRWWQRHRRHGRDRCVAEGFRALGYRVERLDTASVPGLLDAIWDERPWVTRNARRALAGLAQNDPGSESWSRADAFFYWKRWCTRLHGARRCRTAH